jgi:SAM-dependent methyltransferase
MRPEEYSTLFDLEATHWWFRGMRAFVADAVRAAGVPPAALLLDAGCGTGQTLAELGRDLAPAAFGFDLSPHAAAFWPRRGPLRACRASVHDVPFRDGTFDAVVAIDLFESDGVDERRAFAELWRVTRAGGVLALVVPAYAWLRTEGHHRAVHASRRYTRSSVRTLLETRPVRILRLTHLFAAVFPAIASLRLLLRTLAGRPARPRSEVTALPATLNGLLASLTDVERRVLRRWEHPVGSSILAVARKGLA